MLYCVEELIPHTLVKEQFPPRSSSLIKPFQQHVINAISVINVINFTLMPTARRLLPFSVNLPVDHIQFLILTGIQREYCVLPVKPLVLTECNRCVLERRCVIAPQYTYDRTINGVNASYLRDYGPALSRRFTSPDRSGTSMPNA